MLLTIAKHYCTTYFKLIQSKMFKKFVPSPFDLRDELLVILPYTVKNIRYLGEDGTAVYRSRIKANDQKTTGGLSNYEATFE